MSVCLFGDEKHFKEMRVRVVFEIVTNIKRYINKETYNRMSENSVSLEYVFETSVSPECYVREDLNTSLRSEMIKSSKDGEYAGLLQIFAAVNAIHRPVYSIYPRANNPAVDRKSHNLCIVPFSNESSNLRDKVHVMWTHTSNTNMTAWSPNHFVACVAIPDSDSGDNFSSESTFEGASRYFDTAGGMDTSASRENLSSENTMGSSSKPQRPETLPKKRKQSTDVPEDAKNKEPSGETKWQTPDVGDFPNQPKGTQFPMSSFGKKNRSMNSSWFNRWSWLHYLESADSVFCFYCVKAYQKGVLSAHKKEATFISNGFKNWKKATERFAQHEKTDCHKEVVERGFKLQDEVKDVGYSMSSHMHDTHIFNRTNLVKIIEALHYLARQGIALRGHGDEKDSNFHQLVLHKAKHDPDLQKWLGRKTNKYVAPDIQNEILKVMARQILRELISPIKTTEFFSIMADETTDASNTEQLVLCVRWVDASLVAHEDLIGMYELKNIEANTITEAIKDALLLLDLPLTKLRG